MEDNSQLLFISALQHYAYCPRQFALIHIEQAWQENRFTAEGRLLHERVDSNLAEQRGNIRYERSVMLESQRHQLRGKMDLLEVHAGEPPGYFPVEYKRGKPKLEPWDEIQLCAQAICLEEMRNCTVKQGAIWYWEVRQRQNVEISANLRDITLQAIDAAHAILRSGTTPEPTRHKQRCRGCSLRDLCEPEAFRRDKSSAYVEELFKP